MAYFVETFRHFCSSAFQMLDIRWILYESLEVVEKMSENVISLPQIAYDGLNEPVNFSTYQKYPF